MINIIRSDLFRLRKATLWLICLVLLPVLLMTPGLYSMNFISYASGDPQVERAGEVIEEYCESKGIDPYELTTSECRELTLGIEGFMPDLVSIGGNYIYIFVAALIFEVLIITRDLSCHSVKNTLTAPVSRKTYYFSKLATVSFVTIAGNLALNIYTWAVNLIINGSGHSMPFGLVLLASLLQILPVLTFITIFNVLAFLIQKSLPFILSAFAIYIFLCTMLINIFLIVGITPYFLAYIPSYVYGLIAFKDDPEFIGDLIKTGVVCVTVIAAAVSAGYLVFRKQEIK
ncbi:MAG: hypothetical protein J5685_02595 [Clostridiales bacterium]|nr:hypothetical protein [Clostridiales bacterium]